MTAAFKDDVIQCLPFVRRYARALTGSQAAGDALVAAVLKHLPVSESGPASQGGGPDINAVRLRLFREVTRRAHAAGGDGEDATGVLGARERQILLLTALEGFGVETAADILEMPGAEAVQLVAQAKEKLRNAAQADVLIIEDEPVIALDIAELVQSCGHRVVGVAAGEREAVKLAGQTKPGLILADINLRHGGDGQRAVAEIQKSMHVPVIFITAYPERLLTGALSEPAFLITKPFEPTMLAITTYQAVSGGLPIR
ncbi:MAG: response regulator [Alphaproteobacteria bacterium]|nr:response regulator [Alphaproteobacteria bacterium]